MTRPFTLLPPLIGMVSGAFTGLGALAHREGMSFADSWSQRADNTVLWIGLGALLAASLNAGSNVLNQWTDLANDRINKPHRPLPAGEISLRETFLLIALFYVLSFVLAALIRPDGRMHTLWVMSAGAILTVAYSCPPIRTKRFGTGANFTIAIARGCLLKVCGWSCVAAVFPDPEPWFIGGVFALFLMGAASTKDFADMKGDEAAACITWPIRYGARKAAWMITPFLVIPWLLIPLGGYLPGPQRDTLLTGNFSLLVALSLLLAVYGGYVARLILRDPDELATTENHPSWTHMYLQMMLAQVGLMLAYVF